MANSTYPAIRTDWLADVSWRLAAQGLEPLRCASSDLELSDMVDGKQWRIVGRRLSARWATRVEIEADVYVPGDGKPSMRAGFTIDPRIDDELGAHARLRVELGPRGPVTFDPESWLIGVPVGRHRPLIAGVEPGAWQYQVAEQVSVPAGLESVLGDDLDLGDMAPVVNGEGVPELVLAVHARVERKSPFSRWLGTRHERAVRAVVHLTADEPIHAAWERDSGLDILAGGRLNGVSTAVLDDHRLTLIDDTHHLVLKAHGLRAEVLEATT